MSAPASTSAEIFDTLHALLQVFRNHMLRDLADIHPQLSFGELRLLQLMGRASHTHTQLVERSLMDKAQLTRMLAQMEDKGWLLRQVSTQDRRQRELRLSAEGLALYQALQSQRAARAQALLQDCPPALQTQLLALLQEASASARKHSQAC